MLKEWLFKELSLSKQEYLMVLISMIPMGVLCFLITAHLLKKSLDMLDKWFGKKSWWDRDYWDILSMMFLSKLPVIFILALIFLLMAYGLYIDLYT